MDDFRAEVECREDETFGDAAWFDGPEMKALRSEEVVHPPIRAVGRDQLERNREEQGQGQTSSGRINQPNRLKAESRLAIEK